MSMNCCLKTESDKNAGFVDSKLNYSDLIIIIVHNTFVNIKFRIYCVFEVILVDKREREAEFHCYHFNWWNIKNVFGLKSVYFR